MKYIEKECVKHGRTKFKARTDQNGYRCVKCQTDRVADHRKKKKKILIEEFGGKCQRCGYNKCIGALEFHHKDKQQKDFGLSKINFASSLEKLRREAAKCELVCANCHREIHEDLRAGE